MLFTIGLDQTCLTEVQMLLTGRGVATKRWEERYLGVRSRERGPRKLQLIQLFLFLLKRHTYQKYEFVANLSYLVTSFGEVDEGWISLTS